MALLISMTPFYLLGNFHCLGMCGPLATMIGAHRYRYLYFLGRLISFTIAGGVAGEIGAISNQILASYHLSAAVSAIFGLTILATGLSTLFGSPSISHYAASATFAFWSQRASLLLLSDRPLATFIFGFLTIALPCGQTIVVFSACALSESLYVGMLNGFFFSLLTSPSLFLAMHAHTLVFAKRHYNAITGYFSVAIGIIAIGRSLAEIGFLPHLTLTIPYFPHFSLF